MTVEDDQEVHNPLFMTQIAGTDQDLHSSPSMSQKRSSSPEGDNARPLKTARQEDLRFVNYLDEPVQEYDYEVPFQYAMHEGVSRMPSSLPEFGDAARDSSIGISRIVEALKGQRVGKSIQGIIEQMEKRMHIDYGAKHHVGFVGDTGAGKSRLTNALLGCEQLAAQGGDGSSVTQVITEYHYNDDDNTDGQMRTTIVFKPREQIDAEIRQHFLTYLKFKCPKLRLPDDDSELIEEDEHGFKTAENYLLEVFAEQIGETFNSPASLESFIKQYPSLDHVDGTVEGLQQYCHGLVDNLMEVYGESHPRCVTFTHLALDHIRDHMRPFVESPRQGETGYWQLIDMVRTYLPTALLRRGLVIADCPGLTDYHKMRRTASETYLKGCDMVFVLAPVDRITDSPEVRKYVRNYLTSHGLENVVVVPTQTDKMEEIPKPTVDMTHEQDKITQCENIYKALESRYRSVPRSNKSRKAELKDEMDQAKAAWDRACILMRNCIISRGIQKALPEAYRHEHLMTIPVSSKQHEIYLRGAALDEYPALRLLENNIGEDGVGQIRNLIYTRAQRDRLEVLREHVLDRVQLPIDRLHLMLEKNPAERRETVFRSVNEALINSDKHVVLFKDQIGNAFKRQVTNGVRRLAKENGPWTVALKDQVEEWRSTFSNFQTFKAIARRKGKHLPKGFTSATNWNEDLIGIFDPGVKSFTVRFNKDMVALQLQASKSIHEMLSGLEKTLTNNKDLGGIDMSRVLDLFEDHRKRFDRLLPRFFEQFGQHVSSIIADLVDPETPSCFHKAMLKVYQEINSDKRFPLRTKQITKRRWEYLENALVDTGHGSPISALKKDINERFKAMLVEMGQSLEDVMKQPFQEIRDDLEIRFGDEKDFDAEARSKLAVVMEEVLPEAEKLFKHAKMCLGAVEEWDKRNRGTETETKSRQDRSKGEGGSKGEEAREENDEQAEEEMSEESDDGEFEYESEDQEE
ncbi:hypothetical protein C1H76_8392 [Elsinoe australis]|uniref:G domain-containing protein n=1 Tax=Elsinoe australis TaxID=40998 RepID=A0A4U7AN66_9PEZI|nr:hypothetical protein C1H76_8392 [Elsinoe australis]